MGLQWNLPIRTVAVLSFQMSGSFCQERKAAVLKGEGAEDCKTRQELYQGTEMTAGTRKG